MAAGFNLAAGGIVVGVVLLLVDAIAALKPSPGTMLLEAVAFAMIAAWDLFLALLSGGEAVDLAIWGVLEAGIATPRSCAAVAGLEWPRLGPNTAVPRPGRRCRESDNACVARLTDWRK